MMIGSRSCTSISMIALAEQQHLTIYDSHFSDQALSLSLVLPVIPRNTATMSDDEDRVTMPFKFVTGMVQCFKCRY